MASGAYALGALDTLVKAGEVSPAYASGFADALTKAAWWFSTPDERYDEALEEMAARHPKVPYRRPDGTVDYGRMVLDYDAITPEEYNEAIDNSRRLYEKVPWWWNRAKSWTAGKLMPYVDPSSTKSFDDYMLEYAKYRDDDRKAYANATLDTGLARARTRGIAAANDRANVSRNDLATASKRYMAEDERRNLGLDGPIRNIENGTLADAAIRGGLYKRTYDYGDKPKRPVAVGKGLYDMYGANAGLMPQNVMKLTPRRPGG